jgi:nucleoside 2-deoxyribosyltransferase
MAFDTRAYRILVASPSDVLEERNAAVRVMHEWNNLHSHNRRVVLLPLRWETHTAPEYNIRPQEAINRRIVDDCDLVVGIFWTRLGSPTGEADSGTLEEIERAAKAGKPVMLYFSQVPVAPDRVDTGQIERLRKFQDAVHASALVESFGSALEFRDKFAAALELKIRDLQRADEVGKPSPLDLQFVSLDDGKLLGAQSQVDLSLPDSVDLPATLDGELKRYYAAALREAQHKAGTVPMLLGVKNAGNVGIRNLFIEISIRPSDGTCAVSTFTRRRPTWSSDLVYSVASITEEGDSSNDYEFKLAKLAGRGRVEGPSGVGRPPTPTSPLC